MSTAAKISHRALEIAAGAPARAGGVDLHTEHGWCLALTRRVVETALGWADGSFYTRYGRERVERAPGPNATAWWARDLERSMRNLGLAVDPAAAQAGDLVFNWRAAVDRHGVYVGHVGVLTHGDLVLENINPAHRPQSLRRRASTIVLTPRATFPVTTAIRIPEDAQ